MVILIRGAYGETNFGDDLLMLVFEQYFNEEFGSDEIVFLGQKNGYPSRILAKANYNASLKPNIIVYGGGTQFFSFRDNKQTTSITSKVIRWVLNPRIIFKFFKNRVFKSRNRYVGVPYAFLGFGLGPFKNIEAITLAENSMRESLFIGVRDEVSFNYCSEWGINSFLGADVVFSSYFSLPPLNRKINEKKRIGIIVRDWRWEQSGASYINQIRSFVKNVVSDFEFQFIVFAPLIDKDWMLYLSDKDHLIWDPNFNKIADFLSKLNSFDGFISARYHGAIIGAIMSKPVICVEIEPKLEILCRQIPELKLWKKPFNVEELEKLVNGLDFDVDYSESLNTQKKLANSMLLSFKNRLQEFRS